MDRKEAMAVLRQPARCGWSVVYMSAEYGSVDYELECGRDFRFDDGGVSDNEYVFCPHCGGEIVEIDP